MCGLWFSLSQSLCPCCLLITWKCVPLVDLLSPLLRPGRNGLPPTPDTLIWEAVITCTPVTVSFHLGCGYANFLECTSPPYVDHMTVGILGTGMKKLTTSWLVGIV